jgi:ABC-type Mn2+/Zn2+ transport system permease subunit
MLETLLPPSNTLWAAIAMGLLCPVIGRHLIAGRSLMLGLAVPQVSFAGVAFVLLGSALGWGAFAALEDDTTKALLGAVLFTVPVLAVFAVVSAKRRELSEGRLAVIYLAGLATAHLMLANQAVSSTFVDDLFHGRLVLVSDGAMRLLVCALGVCAGLSLLLLRRLLIVLTDPDFAAVTGVRVLRWNLLLALVNGCAIGVAVGVTGPLATFGFLVLPALAAIAPARSLRSHLAWSMALGALMAVAGYALSYRFDMPTGDCVIATGCVLVVLGRLVRR